MTDTYYADRYRTHPDALAMATQNGGQATLEAATLYVAMAHAERDGDLGNGYAVDVEAGTVTRERGASIIPDGMVVLPYHDVYTSEDVREGIRENTNTGKLPEYHHVFEAAESLLPVHYRHHLQDFAEGDENNEPRNFRFQSFAIYCEKAEDDEFYGMDRDAYGWALAADAL